MLISERVEAVSVSTSPSSGPPSGSLKVTRTSYVVPGSSQKRLPAKRVSLMRLRARPGR
jgi:hypothetical protein